MLSKQRASARTVSTLARARTAAQAARHSRPTRRSERGERQRILTKSTAAALDGRPSSTPTEVGGREPYPSAAKASSSGRTHRAWAPAAYKCNTPPTVVDSSQTHTRCVHRARTRRPLRPQRGSEHATHRSKSHTRTSNTLSIPLLTSRASRPAQREPSMERLLTTVSSACACPRASSPELRPPSLLTLVLSLRP